MILIQIDTELCEKEEKQETKHEILVALGTAVVLLNFVRPKYNTLHCCDIHVEAQQWFNGTLQQPIQVSNDRAIV